MVFKRHGDAVSTPNDPEHLYRLLPKIPSAPPNLWSQQADVLRSWHVGHLDARDVALELPTGAGKTLVGGLIAEFRRVTQGARAAFVCPTNQLAVQTHSKLLSYGFSPVLLVGSHHGWNPADHARFVGGDAVAVSNYSSIFNSSPRLSDCDYLVLDDAHAADGYVSSAWSLEIPRKYSAYFDVLAALTGTIDPLVHARLSESSPDGRYFSDVYLASPEGVRAAGAALEGLLDSAAATGGMPDSGKYTLSTLRGHLDQCLVYLSHSWIQIRPLVPPTMSHDAFERAHQRVYMSATLGSGGELERAFGRRRIDRIPAPNGWTKQGSGRRFFVMPELTKDLSDDKDALDTWVRDQITQAGRAIVLTPDTWTADRFADARLPEDTERLDATDIRNGLGPFVDSDAAALVLTNRYDGVDLPDDACRLVIIDGLPAKGDLQERFLQSSLGAIDVLQERVRARVMQGAGRASRHPRDYCVVALLGSELIRFVNRRETLDALYPEAHAELSFGSDQSMAATVVEMQERIDSFYRQDTSWTHEAEAELAYYVQQSTRHDPDGTAELAAAAAHEVDAWAAAWSGDWPEALQAASRVLDALGHGRATQRYAALWNYLASSWAMRVSASGGGAAYARASAEYFVAARHCGRGTGWLSRMHSPADQAQVTNAEAIDPVDEAACQVLASRLAERRWRERATDVSTTARANILGTDSKPFEEGLVALGELLGAQSVGDGGATANPDATWMFGDQHWVCWEAKSDAKPQTQLAVKYARQANGHLDLAAERAGRQAPASSFTVITTPQVTAHPASRALAQDSVYVAPLGAPLDLLDRVRRALPALTALAGHADVESVRQALDAHGALPTQWMDGLKQVPLNVFGGVSS